MEINISSTELNQGISYNYNEGDTIIVTGKEQIDKTGWQSLYYNGKVEKLTVEHSREYHLILNNGQKTIDYDIEHDEHYRPKIISISAPTVEIIGDSAFYTGCLKNISFPLVKSIGKNAFFHTTSLTELCLPSCITIGEDAFFDSALKRISLPAVKTIASGAFQLCDLLKTVLIPVVETIGSCAFRGCSDLEEIYISEGINLDDYFPIRTGKTKVMKIVSTIII